MNSMKVEPIIRRRVYEYMRAQGYPRLTIKILMGYLPDGMDRMTVILGQGSEYDYKLLENEEFRLSELNKFIELSKAV
ncbi:hypothetical protein E2P71_09775 [Candidatus Bathyarchaeota archaeon]|nr:hypothetical protein E2P71_09775 [Candidatus Bathyarchaeota archaeon]